MERLTLGQRIARLRGEKSQQEVADEIGESRESIRNWENDKRALKAETIIKLSDYFGVSADHLLGRTPEKTSDVNLQAVYNDLGLSEKSVHVIRNIKAERFDDGLNFLIEAYSFMEIVERAADLIRCCRYAIEDNERFAELEARAKELQEENPGMMILTGTERLSYDITEAEKALGRILESDSHFWEIESGDSELIDILKRKAKEGKLYG